MGEELVDGAGEEDLSLLNEIASIDNREDFSSVVVGDEDADLLFFEKRDEVFDVCDGERVDVGEWLI